MCAASARFRFRTPLNAKHAEGYDIIQSPLWNKGTAFSAVERDQLHIRGLLPAQVQTIEQQASSFMRMLRKLDHAPLDQHEMLSDLQNRNETLFHRVIVDYVEEISPLVYTPTVGLACQQFSNYYKRPRGMYFTRDDAGHMGAMMHNWPSSQCQVIVVTDGSRILGLGDLGANGMGIPIGKLALYCAIGGIAPHRVLPVMLDFGTDNQELLDDPLYRGARHSRIGGEEYFTLVDEFIQAVFARYPNVLLQFEDFSSDKASALLTKYRDRYLSFNDDIQGTGATVLAGVLGALRMQRRPPEDITGLRVAVVGAGSAGVGVAQALESAMVQAGASPREAAGNFYLLDQNGLIGKSRFASLSEEQMHFARADLDDGLSLEQTVERVKPELVLGLSGRQGTISEEAIRTMSKHVRRPIVMPLSNPTSSCELTPTEAYEWSDGRAIVATGSPFAPVELAGGCLRTPSQCNNMYIFPGVGLGASVAGAECIPDSMLYEAAVALSKMTNPEEFDEGRVFPKGDRIRCASKNVAIAVAKHARELGIARQAPARGEDVAQWIARKMYYPEYVPIFNKPGAGGGV